MKKNWILTNKIWIIVYAMFIAGLMLINFTPDPDTMWAEYETRTVVCTDVYANTFGCTVGQNFEKVISVSDNLDFNNFYFFMLILGYVLIPVSVITLLVLKPWKKHKI